MLTKNRILILPVLLMVATAATTARSDVVGASSLVFHPATTPPGQRDYGVGETMFAQPLYWERAGVLAKTVTATVGDTTRIVPAGKLLQEVLMGGVPGLPEGQRTAYCTDPVRIDLPNRSVSWAEARVYNRQDPQQICVTDTDSDGRVDRSFAINGRRAAGSAATEIPPVAVDVRTMATGNDYGDRISVAFLDASKRALTFELRLKEGGQNVEYTQFSAGGETTTNTHVLQIAQGWPQRVDFYGVVFTVTGYDAKTKRVSVAWTEPRDDSRTKQIPPISAMY